MILLLYSYYFDSRRVGVRKQVTHICIEGLILFFDMGMQLLALMKLVFADGRKQFKIKTCSLHSKTSTQRQEIF